MAQFRRKNIVYNEINSDLKILKGALIMKDENFEKTVNIARMTIGTIGGIGVSAIVGNAVKNLCPTSKMGFIMKTCVTVGTMLLGGVACNATDEYLLNLSKTICKIDEVVKEESENEKVDVEKISE